MAKAGDAQHLDLTASPGREKVRDGEAAWLSSRNAAGIRCWPKQDRNHAWARPGEGLASSAPIGSNGWHQKKTVSEFVVLQSCRKVALWGEAG